MLLSVTPSPPSAAELLRRIARVADPCFPNHEPSLAYSTPTPQGQRNRGIPINSAQTASISAYPLCVNMSLEHFFKSSADCEKWLIRSIIALLDPFRCCTKIMQAHAHRGEKQGHLDPARAKLAARVDISCDRRRRHLVKLSTEDARQMKMLMKYFRPIGMVVVCLLPCVGSVQATQMTAGQWIQLNFTDGWRPSQENGG